MKTRRIACITIYEEDSLLVRTSLVINKIQAADTEKLLFQEDWFKDTEIQSEKDLIRRIEKVTTDYVEKAIQYDAEIHMIEEPVALEKCTCGNCDGYLTNEIRAEDLVKNTKVPSKTLH